jgi:hypothetical protein
MAPAPPAAAPTPPSASEWRYPATDAVPEWARGKSAAEVLAITQSYHDAFNRGGPPAPAAAPAAPAAAATFADDTIVTGKELRAVLDAAVQRYAAPVQQSVDMAASGVYGIARQTYKREFDKYGPEIQVELSKIPRSLWTLDNLDTVVTLVAGRHREDYARERAQELVAQMEPTIRPTGGGSGPVPTPQEKARSLESDSIPSDWKERAKRAGITEATVREFCSTNDMTPEAFFEMFEKSPLQPIVAEVPSGAR